MKMSTILQLLPLNDESLPMQMQLQPCAIEVEPHTQKAVAGPGLPSGWELPGLHPLLPDGAFTGPPCTQSPTFDPAFRVVASSAAASQP